MNDQQIKSISKFLSYILRHHPESIGLKLDPEGWVDVEELLLKASARQPLSRAQLEQIVAENDKKRFAFNAERTKIRASQGHSLEVALDMAAVEPPEYLYHGTVAKFIPAIRAEGLQKMNRQQVHLSQDKETALAVGSRRGVPQVLVVRAGDMHREGFVFYLSENNVWLTGEVPATFIDF